MAEIHFKFEPKQTVWLMYENRPVEAVVNSVQILIERYSSPVKIEYVVLMKNGHGTTRREEFVFATKEELKKSIFG